MIVTHTSPDFDAIGAVWLLSRFADMNDHEIGYVNTGNPDKAMLDSADAVVDTGREYDPARLRFDHHQLSGRDSADTCAAMMVYAWLWDRGTVRSDYKAIKPIVDLILSGDTGRTGDGADWSRRVGIHALLSALKARKASDAELMAAGLSWLDLLASHAIAAQAARAQLDQHCIYKSDDRLVWALAGAPQGATYAAFEAGARIVIFSSTTPESVAVGVMRGGEGQEPHCGELVQKAAYLAQPPLSDELNTWFCHPAGFFAGRGTAKAPDPRPLEAGVAQIAAALDFVWER